MRDRGCTLVDLNLPEDWFEKVQHTAVILVAREQLAGLERSTKPSSKERGMKALEDYLKKHGLTVGDLKKA